MRAPALSVIALSLVVAAPSPARPQSLGELYRKASPSIVVIRTKGREVSTSGVVRFGEIGSGVLVTPDGKAVTASHVVHGMDDSTINTGNSGGPMFNMAGEAIGIVSHKISKSGGSEGLGFVVTANTVRKLLFEKRPFYLGVDGQMVSGPVAKLLNVPQDGGYLVKTVVKDSLAERLGLLGGDRSATVEGQQIALGGDIILTSQGIELGSLDAVIQAAKVIRGQPPGREVRMRVLRAGKVLELATTWSGGPEAGAAPR